MKILYGAGNLNGSNVRLSHFLRYTSHDVRIAAFYNNHECLEIIHWTLDALSTSKGGQSFKIKEIIGVPIKLDYEKFEMMVTDISEWNPDIVISDFEPICAHISGALEIPLISCSPLHLLDGVYWKSPKRHLFSNESQHLKAFERASQRLVYSPFGLLDNAPKLKPGFDWITPYPDHTVIHDRNLNSIQSLLKLNDSGFNVGDSGNIYHDMVHEKKMCVFDSPYESECAINGVFVDALGLGVSLGQAELNMSYAKSKLDKFLLKNFNYSLNKEPEFLHKRI